MSRLSDIEPRIYIASLADYNAGRLHGRWIDLSGKTADEVKEEIKAMLKESKEPIAEEWAIHDYELGGLRISEYESIDTLVEIAEMLSEHGEAWADYAGYVGVEYATKDAFEEAYCGQYHSEKEYAEQLLDELGELDSIPEHLRYYFDYDAYARDLFIGDYWRSENGHVFRCL